MEFITDNEILNLQEGDDVWVGNRHEDRHELKTVVKITPTRVILDGIPEYNTYKRVNSDRRQDAGYAYGRSYSMDGDHLSGLATAADRKEWDAKVKREEAATKARERREQARQDLRSELCDLLPAEIYANGPYSNSTAKPKTLFSIGGLSEAQVRSIAKFLKGQK